PAAWVLGRQHASRPSRLGRGAALRSLVGSRLFAALFAGGIAIGVIDEAVYQHLVPHLTNSGLGATSAGTVPAATPGVYMLGRSGSYVATFAIAIAATAVWVLCLLYVAGVASRVRARQEPRRSTARGPLVGSLESEP